MRTTLTLDDDVATRVQERMHAQHSTLKATINDLLRRGLSAQDVAEAQPAFVVRPHAAGFVAGVDPARLNQLIDDLDADEFNHKSKTAAR